MILNILGHPATAAVLSLAALIVAILVYRWQDRSKELSTGTLTQMRIVSAKDELAGRLAVTFDGSPVVSLYSALYGIKNTGKVPISATDFHTALVLTSQGHSRILAADVWKQQPEHLRAQVATDGNTIMLTPLLLNVGDFIVIRAIVSDAPPDLRAEARIEGVSSTMRLLPFRHDRVGAAELAAVCTIAAVFWGVMMWNFAQLREPALPVWSYWVAALACTAMVGAVVSVFVRHYLEERQARTSGDMGTK